MALTTKQRSDIYQRLSPVIGDEEADALLAQFPTHDGDQLVTQSHLDLRLAEMRGEMVALEAGISERLRQQTLVMAASMTVGMGLAAGIGSIVG